jgi:hypothetical protein
MNATTRFGRDRTRIVVSHDLLRCNIYHIGGYRSSHFLEVTLSFRWNNPARGLDRRYRRRAGIQSMVPLPPCAVWNRLKRRLFLLHPAAVFNIAGARTRDAVFHFKIVFS